MAQTLFSTSQEAQDEVNKLNAARIRDNVEYVVAAEHDFSTGKMVLVGWSVGMCSND